MSILMVLLGHFFISYHTYPGSARALAIAFPISQLGVEFFFVISGFLITTLLLKERVTTQSISLKKFYIRRFFRIIPVAYLYLTLVLFANAALNLHFNYWLLFVSFLFLRNFFLHAEGVNNIAAHYWSLSVEEQFYLLFPVMIKRYFSFYIFLLFSIITLSVLSDPFVLLAKPKGEIVTVGLIFIRQFQSIAVGSLCSIYLFKYPEHKIQPIPRKSLISATLFVVILASCVFRTNEPQAVTLFQSILFSALMILNLQGEKSLSFRLLNNRWIRFIGVLSYSLYIWQQPLTLNQTFINKLRFFKPYQNNLPVHLCISVVSLILLCLVSALSYFCYEQRFLVLKRRFSAETLG
ncbi:MAG: acyltransferase [Gammaproteobacteria bacterium]|nr:acyltransferase [Gammaproteobacteria bacterium]